MIVVAAGAFAQTPATKRLSLLQPVTFKKPALAGFSTTVSSFNFSAPIKPVPTIAANFYSTNLGFFCKQEIKIDKAVKIPFRFRLGSVADCDRLEGKGNKK